MQQPASPHNNVVLIICGPAGSGKTTLCTQLLDAYPEQVKRLVTTTSRPPRPGEVDGTDYHFLSPEVFEKRIEQGDFIEWAKVHGRYYGSQKAHIEELLRTGSDILLNIDIQGADAFHRESLTNPILAGRLHRVFIKPQSMKELRQRLQGRGSDDEEEINRRLKTAEEEMKAADQFDHVIVSGSMEEDFRAIDTLYRNLRNSG
jgi:guanylate kinase